MRDVRAAPGPSPQARGITGPQRARVLLWRGPMLVRVHSATLLGVSAVGVDVEVDVAPGMPAFNLVGLAAGAVQESRVRVLAAVRNLGVKLPERHRTLCGRRPVLRPRKD